jgi:hypothetical protein
MQSESSEASNWAGTLAARLRLLQTSFADDSPATRQQYLTEEVERSLKAVSASQRGEYLAALAEQFPDWQAAAPPAAPETGPLSPESLLSALVAAAGGLSAEQRQEFARQLQAVGLAVAPANPLAGLTPEMVKKLGVPPGQPLHPERTVKMVVGLSEFVLALDQLVWTLWRQLSPRSNYRKEAEFVKLTGPYLSGDPEVSTQVVAQPLERSRRLIAALLGAVGRVGLTYAKKHSALFSPDEIEKLAKNEKKWNESLEFACWRKYREQYQEHATEPAVENEIQEAVAKAAENLILGRAAS